MCSHTMQANLHMTQTMCIHASATPRMANCVRIGALTIIKLRVKLHNVHIISFTASGSGGGC